MDETKREDLEKAYRKEGISAVHALPYAIPRRGVSVLGEEVLPFHTAAYQVDMPAAADEQS